MMEKSKRGFTLIELLVVISIIGILATLLIASYGMVQKSARDTQRKSDINQYRTALENYSLKTGGFYPKYGYADAARGDQLCGKLKPAYISACPLDPRQTADPATSWGFYRYCTDGSGADGTDTATEYLLFAKLETGDWWYVCANGKAQVKPGASSPNPSDCGFTGTCGG